jgi:alkylated DNA nucleotide flippase Atl1
MTFGLCYCEVMSKTTHTPKPKTVSKATAKPSKSIKAGTDVHIKRLLRAKSTAFPAGDMLIASPEEVTQIVAQIPKGRVLTMGDLRHALAQRFAADYTCPVTTGIFLSRAWESGFSAKAPFHRIVSDNGALLPKFPGGINAQAGALYKEKVTVSTKTKIPRVEHLESLKWQPPKAKPRKAPLVAVLE